MKRIHTIIIGAGQAGLATSRCLTDRGIEHVILERGRVAQRWTDRWESLRLLSPNWMTRLPGWRYRGPNPDGFMTRREIVGFLRDYARSFEAPVEEETEVQRVEPYAGEWRVVTDRQRWIARNVVIATGHCQITNLPEVSSNVPANLVQVSTSNYRGPEQFPEGGVLVVGASASGVQLARELLRSGREVVLSAGEHTRMPRRYRGRDIFYWLDRSGSLARPLSDVSDPVRARQEPSLQLVGNGEGDNIGLAELHREGVTLAGHLRAFDHRRAIFAGDLPLSVARAERQLAALLTRVDRHIEAHGLDHVLPPAEPLPPVPVEHAVRELDLEAAGIRSVLWATGYRRSYPWLSAPVLDANGEIRQVRGRTTAAGLWVIGLQFMVRRNSSFIDGVGRDAEEIAEQIAALPGRMRKEAA
jgi:putative flavoprotein involved in K+ transport